jgi:2,3-dihydroxybenzoate-AMP ligase
MLDGFTPWPTAAEARYRDLGYWRGENLADLPSEWATRFGDRTAMVHCNQRMSYVELDQRVDRMAAGLRKHGIGAGDRVVVQLPNIPEFVIVCFALFRLDAKPVFSLPAHRANEIGHLCALTEATGYVIASDYRGFDYLALAAEVMADAPALRYVFVVDGENPAQWLDADDSHGFIPIAEVDAEQPTSTPAPSSSDVAFFLLSGGTTALPKLIPRTHEDYTYQTRAAADLVGLSPEDVYLAVLPAGFNFTWGCPGIVGTLRSGGTVVFVDDPVADDCFETIERERVTVTSLVPALAQLWLEAADGALFDLSSLRLIQIGGPLCPARSPSGSALCSAASCNRCSAWPKGCSRSPGRPIRPRRSLPRKEHRSRPTTKSASLTTPESMSYPARPGSC